MNRHAPHAALAAKGFALGDDGLISVYLAWKSGISPFSRSRTNLPGADFEMAWAGVKGGQDAWGNGLGARAGSEGDAAPPPQPSAASWEGAFSGGRWPVP